MSQSERSQPELALRGAKSFEIDASKHRWHWVEYQGHRINLVELHKLTRIPHSTLTWRYRRGMRGAELIAPPDPKRTRKADRKVA